MESPSTLSVSNATVSTCPTADLTSSAPSLSSAAAVPPSRPRRRTITRPWQSPLRRPAGVLLDCLPIFQLDVYANATVLVRRAQQGWSTSLVNPYHVAEVLSGVPFSTELCGPDTLAAGRLHGQPYVVTLIRPQAVTIDVRQGDLLTVCFRTPPLVWGGCGSAYRLVALHERDLTLEGWPSRADIPIYHAPFGNIFQDTGICWGTGTRPQPATTTGMHAAFAVFLTGSAFNANESRGRSHAFPANILLRYRDLTPDQAYPCDDLVADGRTLDWMLSGGPWRNT